jgi:hypothetical protein
MPVERTLIADAIIQVQKSIRFANWLFWANFLFAAISFTGDQPGWGFLNSGIALWMWYDVRKGHQAIAALNELKKRGYRAV